MAFLIKGLNNIFFPEDLFISVTFCHNRNRNEGRKSLILDIELAVSFHTLDGK